MNGSKGQDLNPHNGWTQQIVNNQVHKVDRHHEGSKFQSVEWTDPTKIRIHKSTKWTNTTTTSYLNHQNGWTSEEVNI